MDNTTPLLALSVRGKIVGYLSEIPHSPGPAVEELHKDVKSKETALRLKDAAIGELRDGLQSKDETIGELRGDLQSKDETIEELRENIHWKDVALVVKDAAIEDLCDDVKGKITAIEELHENVRSMEEQLVEARSVETQLREMMAATKRRNEELAAKLVTKRQEHQNQLTGLKKELALAKEKFVHAQHENRVLLAENANLRREAHMLRQIPMPRPWPPPPPNNFRTLILKKERYQRWSTDQRWTTDTFEVVDNRGEKSKWQLKIFDYSSSWLFLYNVSDKSLCMSAKFWLFGKNYVIGFGCMHMGTSVAKGVQLMSTNELKQKTAGLQSIEMQAEFFFA